MSLLRKQERRIFFRRARQGTLGLVLVVVAVWGLANYLDDHRTFAWTRPVSVVLVAVVDREAPLSGPEVDWIFQRFASSTSREDGSLSALREWFRREFKRHAGRDEPPLEFTIKGPLRAPSDPPAPPDADASFLERWRGTTSFLKYFEEIGAKEDLLLSAYDVAIFAYFYGEGRTADFQGQRPVAARRTRRGVVYCPLDPGRLPRSTALMAHEICHTLGATDKYEGDRSIFPDGYADPLATPLYPQERAEIMALGIPLAPDKEDPVNGLIDCVVGEKTAREMGWITRA